MKRFTCFIFSFILTSAVLSAVNPSDQLAFMTSVSTKEQERSVRAMIRSIRENAGEYRNCKIYVVMAQPDEVTGNLLAGENVELLKPEIDRIFLDFPLAVKAFAASYVEQLVKKNIQTLVWLDPGVIVLDSPEFLDLKGKFDVSVRPVSLVNNIGLPPGVEPNDYWSPIYKSNNLNYKTVRTIETVVDTVKIQPYYNCEIYSLNPALGICREWASQLINLLEDESYQNNVCTTSRRKLFLHQAVLSGIITARVRSGRINALPLTCSYPFNQHDQLAAEKKVSSLNALSAVIFDYAWSSNPRWMDKIRIDEPLRSWLFDTYLEYLRITNNLYRIEGSANSYLVTTDEGSVLIDPAGASVAPVFYRKVMEEYPLKAILLTHAHRDHSDDVAIWREGKDIPIIAQEEYPSVFEYQAEFAPFFSRRNAIWSRKPVATETVLKPDSWKEPTILFDDNYVYELGGIHFNMIHTPGETPDHATVWIPELSAVMVGDNYYEYFINNSTFRGTTIRPFQGYIHALDTALSFKPELFLPGHGAPVEGREDISSTVGRFRDGLKYIYSETIKGINKGMDVYSVMQSVRVPQEYGFAEYYGKVEWSVRGIWQEYVGWFDENPASMYPVPASAIYSDIAGLAGTEKLLTKASEYLSMNEYVKVLHITDIILSGEPENKPARAVRLKALEALRARTYNFIEKIWLDYAVESCK